MQSQFSLRAILSGLAFIVVGSALKNVAVPTRAMALDFDTSTIGLLTGLYYLGFTISCFKTPWLVKRVGHIRGFIAVSSVLGICTLGYATTTWPVFWCLFQMLTGFTMASVYMIAESWVNEAADDTNRGKVVGVYRIVDLSSMVVGQCLIGSFDVSSTQVFLVANIFVGLGVIPLALTTQIGPRPLNKVTFEWKKIFGTSRIGTSTAFVVGIAFGSFFGLGPSFASASGLTLAQTGYFMGLPTLAAVIFQFALGKLADSSDREVVAGVLALFAGMAGLGLGMKLEGILYIFIVVGFWGAFTMPLYSYAIAIANDRGAPDDFMDISAGLLLVYSFGAIAGPAIISWVMQLTSGQSLYVCVGIAQSLLGLYILGRRNFFIKPVPEGEREHFIISPQTTPAIYELDPRSDETH